jgi:hypothetical protein
LKSQLTDGTFREEGVHDILATALETPEHSGRVRGLGKYVTPSKIWGQSSRSSRREKTENAAKLAEFEDKMKRMQETVDNLTKTQNTPSRPVTDIGTPSTAAKTTSSPSTLVRPPLPPPSKVNLVEQLKKLKGTSASGTPPPPGGGNDDVSI